MATTRFSTLLVLPATLWLAASLVRADEDCIITRPGGVKEPGVTKIKENVAARFTQMTACPLRTVDWMAQDSILQCRNTDRSRLSSERLKAANGTKRTSMSKMSMSASGDKAEIPDSLSNVR